MSSHQVQLGRASLLAVVSHMTFATLLPRQACKCHRSFKGKSEYSLGGRAPFVLTVAQWYMKPKMIDFPGLK